MQRAFPRGQLPARDAAAADAVLLVTQIVTLFSVGTVLATMDWRVALLAVLAPLPSVASQIIQGRRGHELEYSRSQDRRRLSYWQQLVSHPKSLKEILTFQLAPLVTDRHDTLLNWVVRADLKLANRIRRVQTPLMLVSALIGFAAQAVAVLVNTSTAGIATLLAVIQGIATIQASTQQLMSAVGSAYVNQLYLRATSSTSSRCPATSRPTEPSNSRAGSPPASSSATSAFATPAATRTRSRTSRSPCAPARRPPWSASTAPESPR